MPATRVSDSMKATMATTTITGGARALERLCNMTTGRNKNCDELCNLMECGANKLALLAVY